ncbi:RDD family protein [Actinoplanes aureus]|uniref:RDD family protein n=1 Tax=Actinoplanes aureus TaxID=2792083 RepID=A0A931G0U0_9ACTN|nr:RDD family protein [Actinoplanes aureus]MBG0567148.1 RDD family protein [Actinoplanes aureus]
MTVYAGLISRSMAYLLDALIVAVFTGVTATALGLVASVVGNVAHELSETVLSSYLKFLPFIFALYCTLFWALAGRTPGMTVLGLRVVRFDGGPVGWMAALIRAVVLAFFPIGALWLLVDRRRQGLQDKVARTTVLRLSSPRDEVRAVARAAR